MGVYDVAAGQILSQPVTANYEGKALRAGIRAQELQNKALEQEIEMRPELLNLDKRELDIKAGQVEYDLAKLEKEYGKDSVDALFDSFASGMAAYEETGDPKTAYEVTADKLSAIDPNLDPAEARAALDQETGGTFDPERIRAFLMSADEYRQRGRTPSDIINLRDPNTGKEMSFRKDDPEADKRLSEGWVEVSPTQKTLQSDDPGAIFGSTGDKTTDRAVTEAVVSAKNMVDNVKRVIAQVEKMPQEAMGLPGATARFIDNTASAVIGFSELFNGTATIGEKDVPEQFLLDTKLYQDMFTGTAAQSAVLQSMQVGLAYSLARSANPDGRLSDADVRAQMNRVSLGSSSKPQIMAALNEVQIEVLSNTANSLRIHGFTKSPEGKEYYDSLMTDLEVLEKRASQSVGIQTIKTDAEYDALPSGKKFYAPDGSLRQKP